MEVALSHLQEFTIERFESNGVKSALIYNRKKRPKKFNIILNGHLDIIPGKEHQYSPKIIGNRLYGIGSMDMKSGVASHIMVFKELANKLDYPLGLQLVTDEETGGFNGTKYQIDQGIRANFVIVGELTNFALENKAKGILWVKISTKGKSAHGAYPWKGENAIWKMNHFLNQLEKRFPLLELEEWKTTVNLSRIETNNQTFNKIPDDCGAWLDIRYIPEETDYIVRIIKELLPDGFKQKIEVNEPAHFVDNNNHYIKLLQQSGEQISNQKILLSAAHGSSDARHYTRVGCKAIEFGPIGGGMGTDNEWVDIKSLNIYFKILEHFLNSLKNKF